MLAEQPKSSFSQKGKGIRLGGSDDWWGSALTGIYGEGQGLSHRGIAAGTEYLGYLVGAHGVENFPA